MDVVELDLPEEIRVINRSHNYEKGFRLGVNTGSLVDTLGELITQLVLTSESWSLMLQCVSQRVVIQTYLDTSLCVTLKSSDRVTEKKAEFR